MRKILLISAILLLTIPAFAGSSKYPTDILSDYVPTPVLLSPRSEKIDMTGKGQLEFKWSPHEGTSGFRQYYDFRLYKGFNTIESARILKQEVEPDIYQLNLPASLFEEGSTYTWTLRQVYSAVRYSDSSYQSFTIIKK